jgi:exosortase A-associated hydrolase 1
MRRHLSFECAGETLVGTLDGAKGATRGLIIISGGNEIRSGGHRGMTFLAQDLLKMLANDSVAVFRFDRRGIGDSSGENSGFLGSNDDLAAAIAAFRAACPNLAKITGLGLCDAAAALILHSAADALDQRILLNPWTLETAAQSGASDSDTSPALPPAAAIRARYLAKLKNPKELWRLISGKVNLRKLWRGLRQAKASAAHGSADSLAGKMRAGLSQIAEPVIILIAQKDTTAMAFMAQWNSRDWADVRGNASVRLIERDTASHSFASAEDAAWLRDQVAALVL